MMKYKNISEEWGAAVEVTADDSASAIKAGGVGDGNGDTTEGRGAR